VHIHQVKGLPGQSIGDLDLVTNLFVPSQLEHIHTRNSPQQAERVALAKAMEKGPRRVVQLQTVLQAQGLSSPYKVFRQSNKFARNGIIGVNPGRNKLFSQTKTG
jgi:hypothetical protein